MLSALMNQFVLLLDESEVVNGLDVVDFPRVLDAQGMVGDVMCILLYDDLLLGVGLFGETLLHAVDHDVDADVEFASDVVGNDAWSIVTHVV